MSSQTRFPARVQGHWTQRVVLKFGEKNAEDGMKSNSCKNKDIAGQSLDIEWHVCPGATSVQILQELKAFMPETGLERESF